MRLVTIKAVVEDDYPIENFEEDLDLESVYGIRVSEDTPEAHEIHKIYIEDSTDATEVKTLLGL